MSHEREIKMDVNVLKMNLSSNTLETLAIQTPDHYGGIKEEALASLINTESISRYWIYDTKSKKQRTFTTIHLDSGRPGSYRIFVENNMLMNHEQIHEIRIWDCSQEKWTPWHAISGQFLILQTYRFGPGGIEGIYSSISEEEFNKNFEIRYCGNKITDRNFDTNEFIRVSCEDSVRKVVLKKSNQILFDSTLINEVSSDECKRAFDSYCERYK